ncbi:MAG: DNA primase [Planctomycetaceae bacterium]
MKPKNYGYMNDVDDLIQRTPLDVVLNHYGLPLKDGSTEYRMNCVFNEGCAESQYGNLSVGTDSFKRVYAHCCKVKGNLLTLIHGLEHRQPPTGGKLRGHEFKDAVATLRKISSGEQPTAATQQPPTPQAPTPTTKPTTNVPLHRHPKEAARELANLHEDLIVEPSQMSPEAAKYVRSREWMTPDLMRKWGVGWIPGNGRSLFRKNYLVYTHRNVKGEIVTYSGRDLSFEAKWQKWLRQGKPDGQKPNKHRFVKGYQRGLELYGGHADRLQEDYVRNSLEQNGLVIVEGMNDVLRLEELNVCAVGLCSNRATDQQINQIVHNTREVSNNRVLMLPDSDEEGIAGFRDLAWELLSAGVTTRCSISANGQPEDLNHWPVSRDLD